MKGNCERTSGDHWRHGALLTRKTHQASCPETTEAVKGPW